MADVRVGRMRVASDGSEVPLGDPNIAEIRCKWVDVGGLRIEEGLISVEYEANGKDMGVAVIRVATSSFASVDHRT